MERIGERIKARREELGLTQEELAEMVGYKGKSSINKIETGFQDVPRAKIPAFAKALRISSIALSGWGEERAEQSFSFFLEQQMALLGWNILYDYEGNVILSHQGETYEITDEAVKNFENNMALYLSFMLDKMAQEASK